MRKINKEEIHQIALKAFKENNYQPMTIEELAVSQNINRKRFKKERIANNADINFPDVTKTIVRVITAFESPLTTEAAYWLGYIAADGCIAKGQTETSKRLMLECKIDDKEILEKFCNFVGLRKDRISIGHHGASCCLSVYNKNFTTFVTEYEIQEQKSFKENHIDKRILYNDDLFYQFLKGYIDGDGYISTSIASPCIGMVGDKTFLTEIKQKISQELPFNKNIWFYDITKKKNAKRPLFDLRIGVGEKRQNIAFLYNRFYNKTNKIVLTRKHNKMLELLNGPLKIS